MTKNCTSFPARHLSQPVYVTVHLTMPLLFGLSVAGLLLCVVALNARCVRKLSPLFAYLTGAIFMDLLAVFCIAPEAVRDSEVLPPSVSHSWHAAHVYYFANGLRDTFFHSSVWMTSFMTCARIVDVTWPDNKFRCTRISASRIIAFVLFIFCGVINFPRYFEVTVAEVKGHCYEGKSLWHLESTFFGRYHLYDHNAFYPWVTVSILYGFPLLLLLTATLVLVAKVGCLRLIRAKITCVTPRLQDEEDELQTSYLVIMLSLLMLLGQFPHALSQFSRAGNDVLLGPTASRNFTALALCVVLLRCSLVFPACCLFSANFRTALQRCFCCACAYDDEYHEPRCCCHRRSKGKVRGYPGNGHYYSDDHHHREVEDDDAYSVEKINDRLEESRSRLSQADSIDVWI